MFYRFATAAIAIAACLILTTETTAQQPVKIRADWSTIPGQFSPLIPTVPDYDRNVYRHYGKSYTVEPIRLQGGGASLTALAADQVDISTLSPLTLVTGVTEAKLNMRVIAQIITTELPGHLFTHFWVRAADIKNVQDLKGKVIAVSARGANVDTAAQLFMRRNGLIEPRDFQIAEIRFPAMIAALESKRVDAVPLVPPFDRIAARNKDLKPLFSVGDAFGPVETLMYMAKAEFVAKHRAALVDFLEDNIRMRRWMTDPRTRPAAIKQLADVSRIPADQYEEWVYTTNDYYYHPQALVNAERLQGNVNLLKEAGILSTVIDVKPYIDMSLAQEAAARVKD